MAVALVDQHSTAEVSQHAQQEVLLRMGLESSPA